MFRRLSFTTVAIVALIGLGASPAGTAVTTGSALPQGVQSDGSYANSFGAKAVTNVFATTQRTSCYTPEVPYFTNTARPTPIQG